MKISDVVYGRIYRSSHTIVRGPLVRAIRAGKLPGTVYVQAVKGDGFPAHHPAFGSAGSVSAECLTPVNEEDQ